MTDLFEELAISDSQDCGIYLLQVENHKYIGSSVRIKKRLRQHRHALRNNKHDNKFLQNCFNKYGNIKFSILEVHSKDIERLKLRQIEKDWVNKEGADLNIGDPVVGIGNSLTKKVYQYDLEGNFIKEWDSSYKIEENLRIKFHRIHACANPNTNSKTVGGFQWRYEKSSRIGKFNNNTGRNLERREIFVYDKDWNFLFKKESMSSWAKELAKEWDYKYQWESLRSAICYTLGNPKTRTFRKKYKLSYSELGTTVS